MRDRLGKRENLILIGLAAGILVFSFYYFVLAPQVMAYTLAKDELAQERASLSAARAAAASVTNERDRLNRIKEEFAVKCKPFEKSLTDGSDLVFLGKATAAGNIAATEIVPGELREKTHTSELPVRITLQGNYRSLIEFCKITEAGSTAYKAEIRSLSIESGSPSPAVKSAGLTANPGVVKAAVGIVLFSVKNPAGEDSLEGTAKTLTGRYDIFLPAPAAAPAADLAGDANDLS
jgi:Tfp pilus assembly protein PilO